MDLEAFRAQPPADEASPCVKALWHDAAGDWETAHEIVQELAGADAAWVHAYLHRKEGDAGNAGYWYRRAGRPFSELSLDDEWAEITTALANP